MRSIPPGWVEIVFEQETPYGMFRDALVFPEGEVPPPEEIEIMKQQRVDAWIAIVTPVEPEPVPEGQIEEASLDG